MNNSTTFSLPALIRRTLAAVLCAALLHAPAQAAAVAATIARPAPKVLIPTLGARTLPRATGTVLSLPRASAPVLPSLSAAAPAAALASPGAFAALSSLSAGIAASQRKGAAASSENPGSVLNSHFDSALARKSAAPVMGAPSLAAAPSLASARAQGGLKPSVPSATRLLGGAALLPVLGASLPVWAFVAAGAAVIAVVVILLVRAAKKRAEAREKEWLGSEGARYAALIEAAADAKDVWRLGALAKEIMEKFSSTREERPRAYLGLSYARAVLKENWLSKDPAVRIGKQTLRFWTTSVEEYEKDAKGSGFEGRLALVLEALNDEQVGDYKALEALSAHLRAFEKHVPGGWAERMREEAGRARHDLGTLAEEVSGESELWQRAYGAMRSRVYGKLVISDAQFGEQSARRARLQLLESAIAGAHRDMKSAVEGLESILEHRKKQEAALAEANSSQRPGESVEQYNERIRRAAAAAAEAGNLALSKGAEVENLARRLASELDALRRDATLQNEGWVNFVPAISHLPDTASSERAERTLRDYASLRDALSRLFGAEEHLASEVDAWLDAAVAREITRQKDEARRRA